MKILIGPLLAVILLAACDDKKDNSTTLKDQTMNKQITVTDYATDPAIEVKTKEFLKGLNTSGGKPMETMLPADARKVLEGAQTSVQVDDSGVEISERVILQDGLSVKLFIMRPAGVTGKLPAFMFFHGGGWVLGDFSTHKRFIRDLVFYSGVVAVHVEYSRSPEVKYPVAVNECYAATKWVAKNGEEIGVDGSRLAVVGNSAGGNLAAAVALMAKDKRAPAIKMQILFWPVTNADFENTSYNQYATDRFLTKNMMKWFWDNYIPVGSRTEKYAAPLQATLAELKGLPPAIVQTAENDVLRDEGEAYARKMNEAGVPVTLMRMQGMIHDYGLLNPLAKIPEVQSALLYAGAELKKTLNQTTL